MVMLTRSCTGWKVVAPNGRTVCRYRGPLAHWRCLRFMRRLGYYVGA